MIIRNYWDKTRIVQLTVYASLAHGTVSYHLRLTVDTLAPHLI